jgi:uncharacterized protein involved in response to NO
MRRAVAIQRSWIGAPLWSRGFRPFFLAATLWSAFAIAIWPPFFTGIIEIPPTFAPVDWHVHEMIYGYGSAVVVGFLLTAIPNWTRRLPIAGWPLAPLFGLWAAGRLAVFVSAAIGNVPAAVLDSAFLVVFTAVAGREVIAGRNQRNVKIVALVLAFAAANAGFHIEAAMTGRATISSRAGLAVIVLLILLIGGRVVPSFTHNWLARAGAATRPKPLSKLDSVIMLLSALALALWIVAPERSSTGMTLLAAGVTNLWRLSRWSGWATRSDRLVLVLHVGFFFAALGFIFAGAHALWPSLTHLAPPASMCGRSVRSGP